MPSEDRISAQILLFGNFPIIGALRKEKLSVVLKSAQIFCLQRFLGEVLGVVRHRRFVRRLMSCRKTFLGHWTSGSHKKLSDETLAKSHSHQTDAESSLRNRKFSLEAESVVVAVAAGDVAVERMARKINWRRTIKEGETCKTGFLFHSLVMYYYLRL